MANWFTRLFSSFFSIFRNGLDKFLVDNIQLAIRAAQDVIVRGGYNNTDDFVRLLWAELRLKFPNTAGTWLSILANLAVDALKKRDAM